jgi:uncharacterized protein (TIGR02147 family)
MAKSDSVQHFLVKRFQELKTKNPSFSMRAFSLRLNLYPSALNEILKGTRGVSYKKALVLADTLLLNSFERSEFLSSFKKDGPYKSEKKDEEKGYEIISLDHFEYISDWVHFALLSLIQLPEFKSDTKWIAQRLGISVRKTTTIIKRLLDLKLITIGDDKKITRTHKKITTPNDILNLSLQKSHINDLDLIRSHILTDVKKRDYCSYTLPVDPDLLDAAKVIIRQAQDKIDELMATGKATEVYRINSYMYPLTKLKKGKKA